MHYKIKISKSLKLITVFFVVLFLFLVLGFRYFNNSSSDFYQEGNLSFNYPKYLVIKQNDSLRDLFGLFEFKIIKNQIGYGEQFYRCSNPGKECEYSMINGIKTCVYSTPLCSQNKKGSLTDKECSQTDCGKVFMSSVCVDSNGLEPTTGIGCASLIKAGSQYTIYNFQLSCKNFPLIGVNNDRCKDLYNSILSSIRFDGGDLYEGWTLHKEKQYSFMYPKEYKIIDSGDQIKLVLPDGNRFMVIRVDSSIKDLDKFVSLKQGSDGTKKMVTLINIGGKFTYQLYDFLNMNGEKVRRDTYLLNIDGQKSDTLWIDSYVYELPIGEYGLIVDKILGSFKFN
ncbi:MAG TPA: hypothetical protein VL401_01305 [Alphaproteobacteria bacterium]|jgi:hypothetical protein|nr:hypothetical protein [Alphaproteobacteria bacterium]